MNSVKRAIEDEMPFYAECGGLMYLMDSVVDFEGVKHKMVGLFKGQARMRGRLEALEYTLAKVLSDNPLSKKGSKIKGHEFHFSIVDGLPKRSKFAYKMINGKGIIDKKDGLLAHRCISSYMHLHFAQNLKLVKNFMDACEVYKKS